MSEYTVIVEFDPSTGLYCGQCKQFPWGNFIATPDKGMLSDGLGLDFGVSYNTSSHSKTVLMFSMPLHNFFNEGYECRDALGNPFKPWEGYNRRVGYITLTHRIRLWTATAHYQLLNMSMNTCAAYLSGGGAYNIRPVWDEEPFF